MEKKRHFLYIYLFIFLNKTFNILGVCDIDKKYISVFSGILSIMIIRRYFAECVIVLVS